MQSTVRPWHQAPFLRYFVALAAGIAVQEKYGLAFAWLMPSLGIIMALLIAFTALPLRTRYRLALINGTLLHLLLVYLGALLLWQHDIRRQAHWIGRLEPGALLSFTLEEAPIAKARSFKAVARAEACRTHDRWQPATGAVILYFAPQPAVSALTYGSRILVRKPPGPIPDPQNPGGFNYRRYCFFQGISHQAYLQPADFVVVPAAYHASLQGFLLAARQRVVKILQGAIAGCREQGLAEALLIGYRNDLDQQLVQAYTHTGVVHIIAISGMHLALIYGILAALTHPLRKGRWRWLRLLLILVGLWGFSLLAGAGASVVRSTVMFSCVALGAALDRRIPIYNSLALSAFLLLCHDPYWLWDVGFQLSYTAVLSIILFYSSIYRLCLWTNGLLDAAWKSMAVCLAAQILTTPLSIYHFHQFPVLFILTNLVAVPLSTLVLMGELLICAFAWTGPPALFIGRMTTACLQAMNTYIERLDRVSFAVWEGLSISFLQMCLLLALIAALTVWLRGKRKPHLMLALLSLLLFTGLRSQDFLGRLYQRKIIVYAAPRQLLLHFVAGRRSWLLAGAPVSEAVRNFYLKPAATLMRLREEKPIPAATALFCFGGRTIFLLRGKPPPLLPQQIDLLIVSARPGTRADEWLRLHPAQQVVIDPSVSATAARQWREAAAALRMQCHDVAQKGAFVMNL